MKVKIAAIVAALAALVVLAGFAPTHFMEGHGPMMGSGMMRGGMMRGGMMGRHGMPPMAMFFRAANLTPDQQTKVHKIFEDNRSTFKDLSEQMRTARQGMVDKLLAPGQVSDTDLTKQSQEVAQIQQKMMDERLKVALAVRAVMTPEQLQKVQKVVQLHRQMQDLASPDARFVPRKECSRDTCSTVVRGLIGSPREPAIVSLDAAPAGAPNPPPIRACRLRRRAFTRII